MLAYLGLIITDTDLLTEALETYFHCPDQTSQCNPKECQQYIYPELAATL